MWFLGTKKSVFRLFNYEDGEIFETDKWNICRSMVDLQTLFNNFSRSYPSSLPKNQYKIEQKWLKRPNLHSEKWQFRPFNEEDEELWVIDHKNILELWLIYKLFSDHFSLDIHLHAKKLDILNFLKGKKFQKIVKKWHF